MVSRFLYDYVKHVFFLVKKKGGGALCLYSPLSGIVVCGWCNSIRIWMIEREYTHGHYLVLKSLLL